MHRQNSFNFKKTSPQDAEENVLPLINIVFLLLIFFLWVGTITTPDLFKVTPPVSNNEAPDMPSEWVILINQDNKIAFRNSETTLEDLSALIRGNRSKNVNQTYKIKADAAVETGQVISVMEVLRNAGIGNIKLMTSKSD